MTKAQRRCNNQDRKTSFQTHILQHLFTVTIKGMGEDCLTAWPEFDMWCLELCGVRKRKEESLWAELSESWHYFMNMENSEKWDGAEEWNKCISSLKADGENGLHRGVTAGWKGDGRFYIGAGTSNCSIKWVLGWNHTEVWKTGGWRFLLRSIGNRGQFVCQMNNLLCGY